jgi:hypothetical protein
MEISRNARLKMSYSRLPCLKSQRDFMPVKGKSDERVDWDGMALQARNLPFSFVQLGSKYRGHRPDSGPIARTVAELG